MRKASIRLALGLVLAAYAVMLFRHTSFAVGGADSSGYMNEARLMTEGRTRLPIVPLQTLHLGRDWAHVFTPLGFTPVADSRTMVPLYPPGLPAHFAVAAAIGGWSTAPFVVVPLMAIACLLLIYALARQFGLSEGWSLGAAAILAACPIFIFMGIQPMSDVVATAWTLAAILCAIVAERRLALAIAAGAAFGISVCVRPTNLLVAIPLAFALRWRLRPLALAAAGALPFGAALFLWQRALYGSALRTGYGGFAGVLEWRNLSTQLPLYSWWLAVQLTPLVFPCALFIAFDRRIERFRRALLLSWFFVFFAFYCFYGPYDAWWYTRFLLPAIPSLIIAFLLLLRDLRPQRVVATLLVIGIVIVGSKEARLRHALDVGHDESTFPEVIRWSEQRLPPDAIVLAGLFSGAFLYYSGRFTVRYDQLDNDQFQLLRAYAGVAGLHWYALLPDWERDEMRNLSGKWTPLGTVRRITLWRLDW